jgi:hypothetical protein
MASIYRKKSSSKIWVRYLSPDGKWKGKPTPYRWGNLGDERQAKLLARKASEREAEWREEKSERFSDWVLPWLLMRYSAEGTGTLDAYKRRWRTVTRFLNERHIHTAGQVTRELAGHYLAWRTAKAKASRNTAIADLKLLSMAMEEAVRMGHCTHNPLTKLGLKKSPTKPKRIWSDQAISKAVQHFAKNGEHWMRCVIFLGIYQACRLRQCAVPVECIRLEAGVIQWPGRIVKGGEGYTQPIDSRLLPVLRRLVSEAPGEKLCAIPWDASMQLRAHLDSIGLQGHCHHGLRATWITRAAEAGVPESQAMAFCHHSSREVHEVYKRLSSIGIAHVPALVSLPSFS